MTPVRLALNAMATRFELVLHGEKATRARAAGEAALAEVERLEAQLSLYRSGSEIARVNALAAHGPVRVSPPVFALLRHARQLHAETGGAFDIAVAPLVRCWGFMHGSGRLPEPAELEEARACSGMAHVSLDEENHSVRFDAEGVMLDLGAIGKGYAIDCAVEILREAGVTCALLHGGTSTVYGLGAPPGAEGWKIAIDPGPDEPARQAAVWLRDNALSISAVWGKSFEAGGKKFGHVMDPRAGHPVNNAAQAAVVLPSATETDALSTALLVAGLERHDAISRLRPGMATLVIAPAEQGSRVEARGISIG
ncbi:MAG TPA: FAD:protein FMN transferase [Verrucomicrobiae bacterium]|jgi:thiamine biosynthesis lipoprotein